MALIEAKVNAALLGPPRAGKTHIAVALAVAVCPDGFSVYFTTLDDMVRQLKAADAIGRPASKLRAYLRPHVLVLGEVAGPGWPSCSSLRAASEIVPVSSSPDAIVASPIVVDLRTRTQNA